MKVYVSGPYTKGDPCENTHNAIKAGNTLLDHGLIPFVPHLSHFWHTVTPRPYDDWMKIDLAFLPACDVFLRLPGESSGADIEEAEAVRLGIPVYHSITDLLERGISDGETTSYGCTPDAQTVTKSNKVCMVA